MRILLVLLASALLTGLGVSSVAAESVGERVARQAAVGPGVQDVGADSFSGLTVPFPGGVLGEPGLVYQSLMGYRPTTLDLFLPPARFAQAGPRPWLLYIHGGGWVGGGPRRSSAFQDWPRVLAAIAAEGYVVASVSYRFSKEAPFPAAIQDVKAAIRWLRVNAGKYHLDPDRGMTIGQSAGGHLAALAAVSCGVSALRPPPRVVPGAPTVELRASTVSGADEASDCVQGAVAWFGVYDFAALQNSAKDPASLGPVNLLLACGAGPCAEISLRAASPITYISGHSPPILLMHGDADQTVPVEQSEQFYRALQRAGVPSRLTIIPGVGHSWIGRTPEATRAASLQAIRESLDFIQSTIGDRTAGAKPASP
jgi:acetyl esterase/lipase